ncbi:hypothetical protein K4A83_11140 [Spirulina subsalsa FACHB-351]|uniref:TMhelix containing protein n=1 Tax=Spirulina subsalsa FACHB-351 TaxID=234711 RepID=A0ABT3L5T6_9CYAN|nr:hypothetical protein [Spirulina subsalsa]MCW6036812.1 hypothetical protein [Spirulina subsalsa FACHB-351]
MNAIAIALGLAQATGMTEKLGDLIAGKNGAAVADRVVDVAKLVTGMRDGRAALEEVQADQGNRILLEEALVERETELLRLANEDRANARDYSLALVHAEHSSWLARNFVFLMSGILLLFAIAYSTAVTFIPLTPQGERYADLVINVVIVGGIVGGVLRFFLGGGKQQGGHQLGDKRLRDFGDYGK